MPSVPQNPLLTFDDGPDRPSAHRRTKLLVAGVAAASAGVLAIAPVTATPTVPEVQVKRGDAAALAAFENPLAVWQDVFTARPVDANDPSGGLFYRLETLNEGISGAAENLSAALADPDVQAQFTGVLSNLTDPQRFANTLAALPDYGDRLGTAGTEFIEQVVEALEALPGVLQVSGELLAEGRVLEAYAEVNLWFLTAGLSDFRGSLLDAFRVPGDLLDSVGFEPLARILGTTWMDEYYDPNVLNGTLPPGAGRPGYGPGLLSRGIIGNFGRALLAPQVTAIFQAVEIVEAVGTALRDGDFETAASDLVNAPAKITNAFLNGYVPAFVTDPDSPIPPGPGQSFPGLFSSTGTFDFFLRQVPAEIARALEVDRPAPATPTLDDDAGPSARLLSNAETASTSVDEDATADLGAAPATAAEAASGAGTTVSPSLTGEGTDPAGDAGAAPVTSDASATTPGADGTAATPSTDATDDAPIVTVPGSATAGKTKGDAADKTTADKPRRGLGSGKIAGKIRDKVRSITDRGTKTRSGSVRSGSTGSGSTGSQSGSGSSGSQSGGGSTGGSTGGGGASGSTTD